MFATRGAQAELYGWDDVLYKPEEIVICEGEFDRLVLKAQGFRSATSTGGARTFRPEWAKEFEAIPHVYICFDRDEAGRQGAIEVGQMIPRAKIIELPEEVGEGGDITDFFIRLGRTDEDFRLLMQAAKPAPAGEETPRQVRPSTQLSREGRERIERVKTAVPIAAVVGRYVKLEPSGETLAGLCPFHKDEHPSLTVYPETGTFYCFGCGTHGDAIDFLRKVERLGFREALDALEGFDRHHGEAA
jgi:DNA primase